MHPQLEAQFEKLKAVRPDAEHRSAGDGTSLITVRDVPTGPPGKWNRNAVTAHMLVPLGYPQARPDCFWTDSDLRLASGGMPANANLQPIPGYQELGARLWFSWHVASWNPMGDDLVTYLKVIERRLREPR